MIGVPSPAVINVKGTLICGADTAPPTSIHDTPPVPLSAQGDASFSGTVGTLPATCLNAAFLIRVVGGIVDDTWIAYGAGRTP